MLPAVALLHCDSGDVREPLAPPRPASHEWIDLTLGGIPKGERDLLIVPPSGFRLDVIFPDPTQVVSSSVSLSSRAWSGRPAVEIPGPAKATAMQAVFAVAPEHPLAPGNHTVWATIDLVGGGTESVSLDLAVREPTEPAPLANGQWIHLDFDVDRDGDGLNDFSLDLATFGLASGLSPSVEIRIESWVIDEIVRRTQLFYVDANPSALPGDDPLWVTFSADPPDTGPYTRICVGGANPHEGSIIGNVMLDPGNRDLSDEACDDFLPSGVFPREITYYADEASYQEAFSELIEQPAGTNPLDPALLSPRHDPADLEQRARFEALRRSVETFAQVVATVTAHEAGHAMGIVPEGPPGRGLFGGTNDSEFTHNLTPGGEVPRESWLMNPGETFSFDDLAGTGGRSLPRLRSLNFAYLQGRLLLDARVDGLYMPPIVTGIVPSLIEVDGPLMAVIEVSGSDFHPHARLTLRGPPDIAIGQAGVVEGQQGAPDQIVGSVLAATLFPSVYDVEIENPDGQRSVLRDALEIR